MPSQLTLWLIGLGVEHRFSRPNTPTDQAQIERTHRTLDGFVGCQTAGSIWSSCSSGWMSSASSTMAGFHHGPVTVLGVHLCWRIPNSCSRADPIVLECERQMFDLQPGLRVFGDLSFGAQGVQHGPDPVRAAARDWSKLCRPDRDRAMWMHRRTKWVVQQQDGGAGKRLPISGWT